MSDIAQMIADAAARYGVAPALAIEVATQESGLNPNVADSSAGAIGIMQLEPATAVQLGVDPRDPAQNIDGGVRYLRQMLAQFADVGAALAAYNWGASNVSKAIAKYGGDWLAHAPGETRNYVAKILGNLGTQYSVSASSAPPPEAATDPASSFTASIALDPFLPEPATSGSFGRFLLIGVLGFVTLWVVEEAMG